MSGLSDKEFGELGETFDSHDLNGGSFINPERFDALLIELDGDVSSEARLRNRRYHQERGTSGSRNSSHGGPTDGRSSWPARRCSRKAR
jgi:hypothetical protein